MRNKSKGTNINSITDAWVVMGRPGNFTMLHQRIR